MEFGVMRCVVIALLSLPAVVLGQSKTPVHLVGNPSDDDIVGRQLVFEVKEAIRRSQAFLLVEDSNRWPYLRYAVSTVRTAVGGTAMGYSITFDNVGIPLAGALIVGGVQTCGRDIVVSCARTALANIDDALGQLRRDAPELWKALNLAR